MGYGRIEKEVKIKMVDDKWIVVGKGSKDDIKTKKELAEYFGVNIRTIDRWVRQGHLPKPYKIGPAQYRSAWSLKEVEEHVYRGKK